MRADLLERYRSLPLPTTRDEHWRFTDLRGFDPEAFRRDYEADSSRGPRSPRRPSKQQMDAVEAFQRTGDFEQLKQSLGTESSAVANSALRRVVQFKALGGVKTVRRRADRD